MHKLQPSEAELEILQILWEHQPCTIKVVHEEISKSKDVGYTTTQKQIQRMLDKGLVGRTPGEGKSHLYTALAKKEEVRTRLFDRLVENAFGNSVSKMVMHALGGGKATKKEIEEIRKYLDELDKLT